MVSIYEKTDTTEIRRLIELQQKAYSRTGLTRDESTERHCLEKKYDAVSLRETMLTYIEMLQDEVRRLEGLLSDE